MHALLVNFIKKLLQVICYQNEQTKDHHLLLFYILVLL